MSKNCYKNIVCLDKIGNFKCHIQPPSLFCKTSSDEYSTFIFKFDIIKRQDGRGFNKLWKALRILFISLYCWQWTCACLLRRYIRKFYFSKEIIIHKYYSKSAIYYLWLYYILWLDLFCPHSEYYILYQKILEYTVEWIKFTNTFICKFFLNNVPLQFQIVCSSFSCNPLPISGCSVCIFLLKN